MLQSDERKVSALPKAHQCHRNDRVGDLQWEQGQTVIDGRSTQPVWTCDKEYLQFLLFFLLNPRARVKALEMWIHAWSFCYNSLAATVKRVCLVKSAIIHKFIPRIACMDLNELSLCLIQTEQLLTGVRQGWHTLCSRCYLCYLQMYYRICPWHGQRSLRLDC